MSRIIPSTILLLLLASAAAAQTVLGEAAAKRLKAQAGECTRAFVESDFERLADYTLPKVVELIGGRAKMVEVVRKDMAEMKTEGFETLSYETSDPTQVLRVGGQTYAVVPAKLRMRTPEGVFVSESFMIAVSADGGSSWKFVGGSSANPATLKILLPAAAARLKLPRARYYPEAEKAP